MTVVSHSAKFRQTHKGYPYYFYSAVCEKKFIANPVQYLKPEIRSAPPILAGAIYTCPMHPQIRQHEPGSCPICGMALEPKMVTADTTADPELIDMTRRV